MKNQVVVLFGAGKGAEESFEYIKEANLGIHVAAIADNDASLWGKFLFDTPIIPPRDIPAIKWDSVIVTSVSGREPISGQLEGMGFSKGKDFLLVGKYPSTGQSNFAVLQDLLPKGYSFSGKDCLHIGLGGEFELESLLLRQGARVTALDKYGFGMAEEPDIPKDVNFIFPVDLEDMPMEDNCFDLVFSFAVLEHTRNPEKALRQIARVLRPGGITAHTIVTRDHRAFSAVKGYHSFSYRRYSEEEWRVLSGRKFYQNRFMPCQWRDLAEAQGLAIRRYEVLNHEPVTQGMKAEFHPDFQRFDIEELEAVDCLLVASKEK